MLFRNGINMLTYQKECVLDSNILKIRDYLKNNDYSLKQNKLGTKTRKNLCNPKKNLSTFERKAMSRSKKIAK